LFDQVQDIRKLKKIIYMDTDMLCVWDISELDKINIKNNIIWAVEDEYIWKHMKHHLSKFWLKKYFNAWLLIINIKKRINFDISNKTILFLKKNKELTYFADQDWLNKVLKDKIFFIKNIYNKFFETGLSKNNVIIHYVWQTKPLDKSYLCKWWNKYIIAYAIANKDYILLRFLFLNKILVFLNKNKKFFIIAKSIYRYFFPNSKKIYLLD
jgi:lipopolysaccharide biosynthesis glycosyltransferase